MSNLEINKKGDIEIDSRERLNAAADFCIKTGLAPETLRSKGLPAVASAILLCKQIGLSLKAMNNMYYIRGQIHFFGYLLNTIAMKSPNYDKTKYFFLNKEGEIISYKNKNLNTDIDACVFLVKTKSSEEWNEYFYTKDMALKAGLLKNQTYTKHLGDMLMHRAKARALYNEFPDVLNGVLTKEASELQDVTDLDAKTFKDQNVNENVKDFDNNISIVEDQKTISEVKLEKLKQETDDYKKEDRQNNDEN